MPLETNITHRLPAAMSDELIEILTDLMPNQAAAEEAARAIGEDQGDPYLPEVIWTLTNHRCQAPEARQLWDGIVAHTEELTTTLGRHVGYRVAALDYFSNILRKSARPRVVHPELLEHLYQQATNDALTGLANRRYFRARLVDEIARAQRYNNTFVELLFDIDNFKSINDTRGHAEGDRILVAIADAIRDSIRDSDVGARWGGEEFAVLMPETSKEGGTLVAERIRILVQSSLKQDGVTISGGVAAFPTDGRNDNDLFQFADRSLYQAKTEGKNQICTGPSERRASARLQKEHPLRVAPVGAEDWVLEATTTNISEGGLAFNYDRSLWVADEVRGSVVINDKQAEFEGRIAHIKETSDDAFAIGVAFTNMSDADRELLAGAR